MRYMAIYKTQERNTPPTPEEMAEMGRFTDEQTKAGILISSGGCLPSALGARVRSSSGKLSVTDGPFTETKELIAGFWLWQVKSKEEALEWLKRAPFQEGEVELRQVFETEDFGDSMTPEMRAQEERLRAQVAEKK
jgi:hypothetical protein